MSTVTAKQASVNGSPAAAARAVPLRAREIAQRGIESASDLIRFGSAMIRDVLDPTADLGVKEGNLAIRAGNFTIRSAEYRQRHGDELVAAESDPEGERRRILQDREAALTAELEAVREQRGAALAAAV